MDSDGQSPTFDITPSTSLKLIATLSPPSYTRTWQSSPHPTLPILATATSDKSVHIYSLTTFRLLNKISGGHKRSVRSVGWRRPLTKGGRGESVLATGSFDSSVGIWRKDDMPPNREEDSDEMEIRDKADDDEEAWAFAVLLTGHDSEVKSVAFSPSNPSLLATSSRDKSVWIWEEVSGSADEDEYETIAVLTEHSGDVKCVAWNYDNEVLASGSYDDTIRLWREVEEEGDWMCIACIEGHQGTVWCVQWERLPADDSDEWRYTPAGLPSAQAKEWQKFAEQRGPRIVSCSDDLSIRIWKREHRSGEPDANRGLIKNKIPSIIKPATTTETWVEDSILPRIHVRSVYSVAWSERTHLIASCAGDGSIYVYKECMKGSILGTETSEPTGGDDKMNIDTAPPVISPSSINKITEQQSSPPRFETEWKVILGIEAAHGEFEVNHICWTLRRDKDRQQDGEEMLVSTGDDGSVKVWAIEGAHGGMEAAP